MRKVLVTGGSSGIGAAIVRHLSLEGYEVVFTFRTSGAQATALCQELDGTGRPRALECDLADERAVVTLGESLAAEAAPYYALVHAAGASYDTPVGAASLDTAKAVMQVNFWSMFQLTSLLIRGMTRYRSGRIVAIGSVVSTRGSRGNAVYAATKGALDSFVANLVLEAAHRNVTVNVVVPGYIETRLMAPYAHMRETLVARIPAASYGRPEDVAEAVGFLLSDRARYVNGSRLPVDGGLAASLGVAAARKA